MFVWLRYFLCGDNLEYHMILSICRRELFLTKIRHRVSIAHVLAREHEMLSVKQNFPLNCWRREWKNRRKGKIDCFFREFRVIEFTALICSSTKLNLKLILKHFSSFFFFSLNRIYCHKLFNWAVNKFVKLVHWMHS